MKQVERLLQVCMAIVAVLGVCLLSMEQRSSLIAILFGLAATASVYVTDMWNWVDLPKGISNVVALVALGLSLAQITRIGDGTDLLALANLLIYLQMVLLFQRKTERKFWQIAALSLLQVIVAAALNLSMFFGVLLGVYFFAALVAMSLLFLYREYNRCANPRKTDDNSRRTVAEFAAYGDHVHQSLRPVVVVGLQTLLATVILFFALPRLRGDEDAEISSSTIGTTGMSAEVALDDMERILENPETVLRMSLVDPSTGKKFASTGEPYLHGTVLVEYSADSRWKYHHKNNIDSLAEPSPGVSTVRQDIELEPGKYPFLFSIAPAFLATDRQVKPGLGMQQFSHQLTLMDRDRVEFFSAFHYSLLTSGISRNMQDPFRTQRIGFLQSDEFELCTFVNRDRFPKLWQITEALARSSETRQPSRIRLCRYLESHFLTNRDYTYSLGRSPSRQLDVDPIEDFVSNHKSGHCEYFASALVIMLRSQGIPARMVMGYKGGDYNEPGKYYVVRHLHAHAWVEAFIERDDAEEAGVKLDATDEGAWLRLDPTPAGDGPTLHQSNFAFLNHLQQWMDYSQVVWSRYVLGMNSDRQREAVYQPILDRARQMALSASDPHAWQVWIVWLAGQFGIPAATIRKAMAWFVTAVLVLVIVGLGTVVRMVRFLQQRRKWRGEFLRTNSLAYIHAPFYLGFERVLSEFGWARGKGQTPQEFAEQTVAAMAKLGLGAEMQHVPRQVVEAYYRVRFGQQMLQIGEKNHLSRIVNELGKTLADSRRNESKGKLV
ncbi:MAG: DUF3488 and DUF4129 domain-containing transglutaminase family protein [Planctomycetota bacterium]|nr:DUF3488 and DUF4129 domain-containing transglutaminase family protein [Planctomycetota bacterium]MDA1178468.1 DUF3488 and DUF4129 domain-containing transglutaminase family protein [Planctomycetota bacterium]